MNYAKLVSILGLLSTIAAAIASQVGAINATAGKWTMFAGAVAAAAGGALVKFATAMPWALRLGLIVAVAAVFGQQDFAGLIPKYVADIVAIIGTAAAASGESLFGWGKPDAEAGK